MDTNKKDMSSQESLKIISDMITRTKINIRQSVFHLIFWGWLITILSLSDYLINLLTDFDKPWLVWIITIPGVFVSMIYGFVKGKKQPVFTYAEKIYMWIWMGFLITVTILFVYIASLDKMHLVGPFILLIAAFAVFMSGIVIKFRPLIIGGLAIWIFSVIGFFTGPSVSPLTIPAAVITGYLIPGYALKKEKADNDSV